jgi:DNA-directed RNA polymerase specialized sigma24 family protein
MTDCRVVYQCSTGVGSSRLGAGGWQSQFLFAATVLLLECAKLKIWNLSEKAFSRLLARFNADPTLAGEEYEKLRARLIYFFQRQGCRIPAELSDETIDRIARKLEEGYTIADLSKFSFRVAWLVLQEHWGDPRRDWQQLDERLSSSESNGEHDHDKDHNRKLAEHRLECMKKCLEAISPEEQELMVKNCTLKKNGKEELARAMGLTINALRLRVFRVRKKLCRCQEKCVRTFKGLDS